MFRSETMAEYQILIPRESSYDVMHELGQMNAVMVIDANKNSLSRPFGGQVSRCDEILVKIQHLCDQLSQIELIPQIDDFNSLLQEFNVFLDGRQKHTYLNDLELQVNAKHKQLKEQNDQLTRLKSKEQYLQLSRKAMIAARRWLGGTYFKSKSSNALDFDEQQINKPVHGGMMPTQKFSHFVGVINGKEFPVFSKVVFRITKGNFMMQNELFDDKVCFLLIFPSLGISSSTWRKIRKLLETFQVEHISLPQTEDDWDRKYVSFDKDLEEISNLIALTKQLIHQLLVPLLDPPSIQFIKYYVIKERTLYLNLNKIQVQDSIFILNIWVRQSEYQHIRDRLIKIQKDLPLAQIRDNITDRVPPTYIKVNQFTQIFQMITDTYGIPSYKEINPSVFAIVTFPFLFGIMFGDVAHGAALLLFGLWISYTKEYSPRSIEKARLLERVNLGIQDKVQDPIVTNPIQIIYDLRYMFILCGGFALYCGLIYNEYFGLRIIYNQETNFGVGPQWGDNLNFTNSMKMKLSIFVAFLQMTFGILVFGVNAFHNRNYIALIFVFPTRLIFFTFTIGYMVLLITIKWTTEYPDTSQAPSIITTFVDMWINQTVSLPLYENQLETQNSLMKIAIICIPIMLFIPMLRDQLVRRENHNAGDVIVHHLIETIEFVLGCISNTASYLRLWALSLAHSQLASVFFQLTLADSIEEANVATMLIGFPVFLLATLGVLLIMDAMECFLHSLRLHWVEFQGKFFKGEGTAFDVYSFSAAMKD